MPDVDVTPATPPEASTSVSTPTPVRATPRWGPPDPKLEVLREEIRTYLGELPRLLAAGEAGRFALIKGEELLSVWDTFDDAVQAGSERFGPGVVFLAQPIDAKYLEYPWPEEYSPRKRS